MTAVRRAASALIAIIAAISLAACSGGEGSAYYKLMTALGFDMNNYESEPMTRFVPSDDEVCGEIERIIGMLTVDSARVTPFETPREASSGNRDAILNYMLNFGYAAYNGNSELLAEAAEAYPQYNITTLIPEGDFESTVYRYFGGDASVIHEDSVRYKYLPRVRAYTTTGQPLTVTVEIELSSCIETEHTYRVSFTLTDGSGGSASYSAMMMKREDGTMYMRYLRDAES